MTIIEKIKQSIEGATGMPFLYHAAGELNELIARCNSLPVAYSFLIDSGTIDDVNGRYHERVTLAIMFCDKTEFDFNALENEQIIDRMKVKAYKWMQSLRMSNALHVVSVNNTQRLYDNTTDILTGFAVNITIEDVAGAGECELPEVVIPITENGIYNVVGADKVDVKLFATLKDLYITRNGVYNPQDFGAYGFGSVNVNVRGEEELEPAYDWLKNRVKGREDGTIPAIPLKEPLDATNLVKNLSVLDNRRITNGYDMLDGVSLARMLLDGTAQPEELIDDNVGWVLDRSLSNTFGASKLVLGCSKATAVIANKSTTIKNLDLPYLEDCKELAMDCPNIEHINIPKLKICNLTMQYRHDFYFIGNNKCTSIDAPSLETFNGHPIYWGNSIFRDLPNCKKISAKKLTNWGYQFHHGENCAVFNCPALEELYLSSAHFGLGDSFTNCGNLILIEIAPDYSQNLSRWNPTTLAERLDEFLSNFQIHIADRAADRTGKSALTLTLSPSVYEVLEAQEGQTILATLTNKNWTIVQG